MALYREENALREYAAFLSRYRWLLMLCLAASLAVGVAYVSSVRPEYECSLRLLGDNTSRTYVRTDTDNPFADASSLSGHDITTQVEILQSGEFLQVASRMAGVPRDAIRVEAKRVFDTDVIGVRIFSSSARHAEQVGQILPTAYERFVVATKTRAIRSALPYAKDRLQRESQLLAAAELSLQRLKDRLQITDLDKQRESLIASASDAASDLRKARIQVSGTERQLATVRKLLAAEPATVQTPVSTTNPSIAVLRERIADLRNERAKLTVLYKPNDTRMQEIDAQVNELTRRLKRLQPMVTTVTRSRNPAVAEYQQQVAGLQANLAAQRGELNQSRAGYQRTVSSLKQFNALEREQARLTREIDQHRTAVGLLSSSVSDLTIRADTARDPTGTLTGAASAAKVWPKTANILGASGMFGLLLGLCIAALIDQFDHRIRLDRDMPRLGGSPILGFLPPAGAPGPARFAEGADLDGYRILAMNLSIAGGSDKPVSLLLCRTSDNESTLEAAVNLAVAMAESGRATILVDADTREPGLQRCLGVADSPGLTDVLRNHVKLEDALRQGPVPGLATLAAGTEGATMTPLVNPALARRLDEELRAHADCVIYHGPPVLGAAEVLQLATVADAVAYVITEGKTRLPELAQAAGMLSSVHANVLGLAIHRAHRQNGRGRRGGPYAPVLSRPAGSLLRLWNSSFNRTSPRAREEIAPTRAAPERGGAEMAKGSTEV